MNTIKVILTFIKTYTILILGSIITILGFIIGIEHSKINELDASQKLTKDDIKDQAISSKQSVDQKHIETNNNSLDKIDNSVVQSQQDEKKQEQLEKTQTSDQIQNYWNGKPKC